MELSGLLVLILILNLANSLKFTLTIPGLQKQCFYELLAQSQKYSLQTIPKNQPKYDLQISYTQDAKWISTYYKMATLGYERMQVHKLATMGTTYSFCLKNIQRQSLDVIVKFNTGVQLMDFQFMPDKSDTQNLQREVEWLESQKKNLYETISNVEQLKATSISTSNLLSTKMVLFAILGLISILVVNFLFYKELKKTFKDRKLI